MYLGMIISRKPISSGDNWTLTFLLYFTQVDAHNIVPCWEASPKLEYGARTIRNKIQSQLSTYMTEFPPVIKHTYKPKDMPQVNSSSMKSSDEY